MKDVVGDSVPRKEGRDKVTGQAIFVDDFVLPGMMYGVTIRSPVARGRLGKISFGGDIPWEQFTVVKAADIPGENYVALIFNDQPFLADKVVNHAEEPILLLAHPDKYLLEEARRHVRIDVEPLAPLFSLEDSLHRKEIIWGKDNIFKSYRLEKGNIDDVWQRAAAIVEGEYTTGAQEQLYIEPNGMIALAGKEEGVTVWGSMQCPYYVHRALMTLFGLPEDKVRVIQLETGGGFGGKEEYPSMIAGHAALLAWKSGKPVKIIYDRAEDMVATTKRHPSVTRHRTAIDKEGRLLGMEVDFTIDGGAYATLSSVVLSRGTIHATGPYFCPNVRVSSRAVATNFPPHGAFRGFGAPQSIFALERHMDKVARAVNLSSEEFRRRNFIGEGETTATCQTIKEKVDLNHLMERAFELSGYYDKRKAFADRNKESQLKKGIGFSVFMHGAGFTGSGERYLKSVVAVEATEDGRVRVLTSSIEMGQGTKTVLSQIAAQALGLPYESVDVAGADTAAVPNSGPTVASRTCMVVGKLVESAAIGLTQTLVGCGLLKSEYTPAEFQQACRTYLEKFGPLKSVSQYQPPPEIYWNDDSFSGDAYGTYAWAVYVAEVTVDMVTFQTRVDDFVAVQEVGKVIHPTLAMGQIEGGVAQGIGYALYEDVVWREGRMANSQMTNYIMPTAADVPPIRVYFEEVPYRYGPFGAKGLGELPIDGPAPAIVNAIESATGASINHVPLTPEILMKALEESREKTEPRA
ncbi:MAG TPA: xanthine dehydrogenase family protein molybdopterin-binding subunit [Acidobacteriota bacterium]|jgi:CO/xanthine dehydrogenase Mo-binding subunit|nr:xanthine dehydrogenase family protein molybdopterin-binding subunit [Acidobacteriota bacterium]